MNVKSSLTVPSRLVGCYLELHQTMSLAMMSSPGPMKASMRKRFTLESVTITAKGGKLVTSLVSSWISRTEPSVSYLKDFFWGFFIRGVFISVS